MLRLRVTDLDQWVRFLEPALPEFEVPLEDFIAYMRRETAETPDMLAGRAFHSWLQFAEPGDVRDEIDSEGFTFRFGCDCVLALPERREESVAKVYDTPAGKALLRGRVDGWDPGCVIDYKLTLGQFDAERYAGSLQWKAYLDMAGERSFRYLVYQGKRTEQDVFIYDVHDLKLWAYPEMGGEVERRVAELAGFVATYVPELVEADPEPLLTRP